MNDLEQKLFEGRLARMGMILGVNTEGETYITDLNGIMTITYTGKDPNKDLAKRLNESISNLEDALSEGMAWKLFDVVSKLKSFQIATELNAPELIAKAQANLDESMARVYPGLYINMGV